LASENLVWENLACENLASKNLASENTASASYVKYGASQVVLCIKTFLG
jgi:hypothetical protein